MPFAHIGIHYVFFRPISPSLRLSSVAEDTIRAYFESRLVLLEPVFPLACHRLCEGPDFSLEFGFKSQQQPEGKTQTFNLEVICVNSCFFFVCFLNTQLNHLTKLKRCGLFFCCCADCVVTDPSEFLSLGVWTPRHSDNIAGLFLPFFFFNHCVFSSPMSLPPSHSRLGHPPLHLPR